MGADRPPEVDDELRSRLGRRYGPAVGNWLDSLAGQLTELAARWHLHLGSFIRRGTVSVVVTCADTSGAPAILKISPDRERIALETRALSLYRTRRVPRVIDEDPASGAVLLEAIEPGTALDESGRTPDSSAIADLIGELHEHSRPRGQLPGLHERIAALFRSGEVNYSRRPDLQALVPRSLYERGRQSAEALASDAMAPVMLHGDLTPANVLDGGTRRGLVAVDPAPCVGDPGFDTVDLLMWQEDDVDTLMVRCFSVAELLGLPRDRPLAWCAAFAAMTALELAEATWVEASAPSRRLGMLVDLADTL
jgi:streptomycin 6-kinase